MSFGTTVGLGLGRTAAYAVHAAKVSVHATGQFGKDVATGTTAGYVVKSSELAARREAAWALRPAKQAIKVTAKKAVTA